MDVFSAYKKLFRLYGPQGWWPSYARLGRATEGKPDHAFEVAIGAILTQSTSWKNVEKALACLYQNKLLTARGIAVCPTRKLWRCVHSSGYYKQKTKKLKNFCAWLVKNYDGDLKKFFKKPLKEAREELLSLWGIGRETADSILLYAGKKPIFVIDAYTKRLCEKFGVRFKTYDEYRNFFESQICLNLSHNLSKSVLYNECHALIVASGKDKHNKV